MAANNDFKLGGAAPGASRKTTLILGGALVISALSACNYVPASRWHTPENPIQVSAITVLPQQSLYDVARQENVPVESLAAENGIAEPYQIYVGQKLRLPQRPFEQVASTGYRASAGPVDSPISTGPISAGTVAAEAITMPPVGDTQAAEPGLYGSVEAADLTAPADLRTAPYSTAGARPATPPPVGTTEVLEAAPRASEPQVASLPTPGVSDVPVDDTAFTPAAIPAPRPASPPRVQDAPAEQQAAVVVPEPETVQPEVVEPVPVPDLPSDVAVVEPPAPAEEGPIPASIADLPPIGERDFAWPLTGEIISTFGSGGGDSANDGINILASRGTEIQAAQDGFVVYAGNELAGFGNLILIRHADNWVTGYAHADQMLVTKDQYVRAGDVIGTVGDTGSVTEPQLHFEVRQGTQAVDPADHLPQMPL